MLEIERWITDKPYLIALIAPRLAVTARDIHEAFQHTRERRIKNHQFELPHLPTWLALYRNHKKPRDFLRTLFNDFSNFSAQSSELYEDMYDGFNQLGKADLAELPSPPPAEIEQIIHTMQNALAESIAEIKEDIQQRPVDSEAKTAMLSLLSNDCLEGSFCMLVTVPCLLFYKTSPTKLYRKARTGSLDALEKLLRLDPLIIHDPYIGYRIQALRFKNKVTAYEHLLEITSKGSNPNITPQQMKYAFGGLISMLAKILNLKLTSPDIHKLYDAIAKDYDAVERDPCLPDRSDTFARAINRYRKEWLTALIPDKKM